MVLWKGYHKERIKLGSEVECSLSGTFSELTTCQGSYKVGLHHRVVLENGIGEAGSLLVSRPC